MKLEDHVPSLELCRKYKEVGGQQDSLYFWVQNTLGDWTLNPKVVLSFVEEGEEWFAAPLASELMEWEKINIHWIHPMGEYWQVIDKERMAFADKSFINALMQMAIWTKKNAGELEITP